MALHIRDERAAKLARRLADRNGISMTEAVIAALEAALARGERPLPERLPEIAADARRPADPRRQRAARQRDGDASWAILDFRRQLRRCRHTHRRPRCRGPRREA